MLTTLEVWSRLWVSFEIGRRNFRNIKRVLLDTLQRGRVEHRFLFTTDGFKMYEWAATRLLLPWPSHTLPRPSHGILGRPHGPAHGALQLSETT